MTSPWRASAGWAAVLVALGTTLLAGVPIGAQAVASIQTELQRRLDSLVAAPGIPGLTVGVAFSDGESFGLAAGWADTTVGEPMLPTHRMLQGSVGKTYFGAVALQLVHEGHLDLDERVATYLGDESWFARLPNGPDVTVRQLMNHTSGIVRYEFNPRFLEDLTTDPQRTWTPVERLAYLFDAEPPFAAGDGWDYSDTNYILLAMILEEIAGTPAYQQIRLRLLEPLGLESTVPSDRALLPDLAQGYAGPRNPFGGYDEMVENERLVINPQFEWAGGGFVSTAEDLARWTRDVHEGRAFDPALLGEFRIGPDAPLGPEGRYGLGVIMMELGAGTAWGHSGFMPGYRTEAYYFPDHGFAIALQINSSDGAALPTQPLAMLDHLAGWLAGAEAGS